MEITEAVFLQSSSDYRKCPVPKFPEYAFIGRSNVGKSSLINMLCQRKDLAKISGQPGKTKTINHFLINRQWYLVDLPGYGFARVPLEERNKWRQMIDNYLLHRKNLVCTFILIDLRLPPQDIDLQVINNFGEMQLPLALAFTKSDKLTPRKVEENLQHYQDVLLKSWEELPPLFITSARTGAGRKEILRFISENNSVFQEFVKSQGATGFRKFLR